MRTHTFRRVTRRPGAATTGPSSERGFTLAEVVVSLGILAAGLLSLAAVFTRGMLNMSTSQSDIIAKEKAAAGIESVYSARDTRTVAWAQINNVSNGGIFLDNAQPLRETGTVGGADDGMVGTADDGAVERLRLPGADHILGNADDQFVPLTNFRRQIQITAINPNLRQITVTVVYSVGNSFRSYTCVGYISSYA